MTREATGTLSIEGTTLEVTVVRKRVRRVNARLSGTRLTISAPLALSDRAVHATVEELARKLVRRARARELNATEGLLDVARRLAARFPSPPPVAAVRYATTQTARWGSYSPKTGVIRLHAALREMPAWVRESVIVHELAHAVHADHSPAFWSLVRSVYGAIDRANAFLAGVSWLARRWPALPPVERALLAGGAVASAEPAGNGA